MTSYASAIFQADDASVAAIGALMETRSYATTKLYYYSAQFAGDTSQTLANGATVTAGNAVNGGGAPLKVNVTRDADGRPTAFKIFTADDQTDLSATYGVEADTGRIFQIATPANTVGYIELRTIEGGALYQVQQDINSVSSVISTFSNLIAANKQALKSVLNVIR